MFVFVFLWRAEKQFLIFIEDNLISPYTYRNLTVAKVVSITSELKQVYYKMYFTNIQNIIKTVNIVIERQGLTHTEDVEPLYQLMQK